MGADVDEINGLFANRGQSVIRKLNGDLRKFTVLLELIFGSLTVFFGNYSSDILRFSSETNLRKLNGFLRKLIFGN